MFSMKRRVWKYALMLALLVYGCVQALPSASASGEYVRIEQSDPRITYDNFRPTLVSGSNYSGGSMIESTGIDAGRVDFTFHSTAIRIGLASSRGGYANVYIDNVLQNAEPIAIPANGVKVYEITGLTTAFTDPFIGEEILVFYRLRVEKAAEYPGLTNYMGIDYIELINTPPVVEDVARAITKQKTAVSGTVKAVDYNEDIVTFSKASEPAHGVAAVDSNGTWTYTPAAGFSGTDQFTIHANDPWDPSPATVTIDVQNLEPTLEPYIERETVQDADLSGTVVGSDPGGDPLTYALQTNPGFGTAAVDANGAWTYTPNAGYYGFDRFSTIASDPYGGTAEQVTAVYIERGAAAPITSADIADGTILLEHLSSAVKDRLHQAPLLTVVQGQAFDEMVAGYDSLSNGGTVEGVTISNTDPTDGYIRLLGTFMTVGVHSIELNGNRFVFQVVEPVSSSTLTVSFDE